MKLKNFRNLADNSLAFADKGHLIIGDNGQGKSNLLEAIYYLTLLRSFRSSADSECIRFGEDYFNLRAVWRDVDDGDCGMSVGFDGRRKKIVVAGREKKKLSEAFGQFKSVIMTPDDIAIVQGGPSNRRKYIDIVLSIVSPVYLGYLKRYRRALSSRNHLLRKHGSPDSLIVPWEEEMAESGSGVIVRREEYVREIAPVFADMFSRLSAGESGGLEYRSSLYGAGSVPGREELKALFSERLESRRSSEHERGTTLSGPQTDDLYFEIEGRPLRSFGSQGQQRTAVISLRMAEAEHLGRAQRDRPVLLLDDIFSELDRGRSGRLLEELVEKHQSFVTAPRHEPFFDRLTHLEPRFIENGAVRES